MRPCRVLLLAGALLAPPVHAQVASVIEFHHAALDHYFVSPLADDIAALDSGRFPGWTRTGRSFGAWPTAAAGGALASPVCRFYLPPAKGDSHFFSASPAECADVERRVASDPAFAGFVLESRAAFFVALPDAASGACAAGTSPVYRLWNGRGDANHRYTTDLAVRDAMLARGWVPEGYGPQGVAMCAPAETSVPSVRVSAASPFAAGCAPLNGTLYANAEVEPHLAVNPANPQNLIGVWQQDRWSNGGARGLVTGYSFDGGRTWARTAPTFSRCAGGHAGNGGDYERASDPWVSFGPDGTAWQAALAITGASFGAGSANAITVSRSADGGRTWSAPRALIVDGADDFNDKEAITADPTDARFVYVAWDRLRRSGGGPAYFARTTDGGATWEAARPIHDPGNRAQTLNNIPVVLGDGTLINFFTRIDYVDNRSVPTLQLMRSPDKGASWDAPVTIASLQSVGAIDPQTQQRIRDAALLGTVAAGPGSTLVAAWQDARFSGGAVDGIAFSRSSDGGRTWSVPVQVNAVRDVAAFVPAIAVLSDGTIGVTYFDLRSNTDDPATLWTEHWLAQSTDGVTWRETRLAGPFDLARAPVANGLFIGDYMGLAAHGTDYLALFTTTNADTGNATDVHFARVARSAMFAATKTYRADAFVAAEPDAAFAARIDANVRSVMQRRVPGWRSPAEPAGGGE